MFTIELIKKMLSNVLEIKVGCEKVNDNKFTKKNMHGQEFKVLFRGDKVEVFQNEKLVSTQDIISNPTFKDAEQHVKRLRNGITIAIDQSFFIK